MKAMGWYNGLSDLTFWVIENLLIVLFFIMPSIIICLLPYYMVGEKQNVSKIVCLNS